ncbi:hypothetical protein ACP8Y2_06795 [Herpetosiphon llansteffanensis]
MINTDDAYRKYLREHLATCIPAGFADDDRVLLAWARSQGLLMIDALIFMRTVHCISLGAAKDRVVASDVWAEQHAAINHIHTIIEQALQQIDTETAIDGV